MKLTININGVEIRQSTSTKFLGITIDHHLEWKEYTDILKQKLAKIINIIKHIKNSLISPLIIYYILL